MSEEFKQLAWKIYELKDQLSINIERNRFQFRIIMFSTERKQSENFLSKKYLKIYDRQFKSW